MADSRTVLKFDGKEIPCSTWVFGSMSDECKVRMMKSIIKTFVSNFYSEAGRPEPERILAMVPVSSFGIQEILIYRKQRIVYHGGTKSTKITGSLTDVEEGFTAYVFRNGTAFLEFYISDTEKPLFSNLQSFQHWIDRGIFFERGRYSKYTCVCLKCVHKAAVFYLSLCESVKSCYLAALRSFIDTAFSSREEYDNYYCSANLAKCRRLTVSELLGLLEVNVVVAS